MSDANYDYEAFASKFAQSLVEGQYERAHAMLANPLQEELPVEALKVRYEGMVSYGQSKAEVDGYTFTMQQWPDKEPTDLGWVYVSISGADFGEAVSVVVTLEDGNERIRSIEWGRP